jgi:hypothetical protein
LFHEVMFVIATCTVQTINSSTTYLAILATLLC